MAAKIGSFDGYVLVTIGVVCGRRQFMKRYRDDRPVDICFARGTFNSHPCVMGAMHEFLIRLDMPEIRKPRGCQLEVVLQNSGYDPAGYHCEPVGTSAGAGLAEADEREMAKWWHRPPLDQVDTVRGACGPTGEAAHGNSDRHPSFLATG